MTDITELAQREKFEAWARSQKLGLSYGDCGYVFSSTEMAWRAWMASSSELVEALEKAQQHENEWKSLCEAAAVDLDDWREIDDKSRDLLCKLADTVIAKAEQSAEWERKAISNFEDCAEMSARLEELESQRKLAFAASNRWADKFREAEKRITELESRAVKLPQRLQPGADGWDDWYVHSDDEGEYLKFDDVLAMLTAAGIKVEAE
ncbi:hypothetical protein [Klebsiella pneumoniae]|uniref:hypothetical protein n=1 Tax=Klebsiella pneumoniae TaxID=573 RepID=UPI001B822609|nr:hypothetical protein [Klebsiella pneumoniae]HDS5448933.1 hypothetical protein [Klebsiella pneumoniae subsp. pneumoniae]MBR7606653.1 hypothetical protein [Klebsiella pneumoniae]MCB8407259.1 hypothetical protein [Klebsiella pneumoniae]MCB8412368.1 hypothetical protein [Klebsiella pneumoniae]HDT5920330.1 hypothetical protein [Klebsiella pneumoniae subsp. pneumoniae]